MACLIPSNYSPVCGTFISTRNCAVARLNICLPDDGWKPHKIHQIWIRRYTVHKFEEHMLWNIDQVNLNGYFDSLLMRQPEDTKSLETVEKWIVLNGKSLKLKILGSFCSAGFCNSVLWMLYISFISLVSIPTPQVRGHPTYSCFFPAIF